MSARRKICVVTGSRAEYGLLRRLMQEIESDRDLQLQIAVTGAHLSAEFGSTYRQIEADGLPIDAKVEVPLTEDSATAVTKAIGVGVSGFGDALQALRPDILVVLGDRYEILAAAQAALIAGVPIAHIHGGETTEGAFDEGIRHAITKFAQWHFVAADAYRKRVIQLGEHPDRVFNFGAPGLDVLRDAPSLSRDTLEQMLRIKLTVPTLVVTYHPATLGDLHPVAAQAELLAALDEFPTATLIFTHPNADTGGRELLVHLQRWVGKNAHRARDFASLGTERYINLMRTADLVVGNSSSGLIEAPALKVGTVNIGDRQKGRLRAASVIDAREDRRSIAAAIEQGLSPEFRATLAATGSLYGQGDASARIKDTLKAVPLRTQKRFFDIDHAY